MTEQDRLAFRKQIAQYYALQHLARIAQHALYTGSMLGAALFVYQIYGLWYTVAGVVLGVVNGWCAWYYYKKFLVEFAKL